MTTPLSVRLFNAWHGVRAALGRGPARFADSEQALLESARAATGLDDFGDNTFREGLRLLLRCYDEEARLTPFGRRMVAGEITGVLAARLLSEAGWKARPEALAGPLCQPLFILGLPRTGTTALHFLLARDPGVQVLEYWLAAAPGPRPPRVEWESDPRFRAAARGLEFVYGLAPELKAIHLLAADGPEECRHLLMQSFRDDTFDSNATIPSYTKWFHQQDPGPAYERHRDVLKLIGSNTPERRWVLKYPAHIRHLDAVLATYPDAVFVWTHRDPSKVLPSLCSLVSGWRSLYEGPADAREVGRWQLDMWAGLMERGIEQRAAMPAERFFDLKLREVVTDPVGSVRRLYDRFGWELGGEAERAMRAWHAANPQGQHGAHRYSAERFGLNEDGIRERFSGYLEYFGVERESAG